MKQILAAVLCAGILLAGGAAGAATISTLPYWNGSLSVGSMGETNAATYGQTFRINPGMDNRLTSVTFYVNDLPRDSFNLDAVDFALYVYQWTGTRITGDALYASPSSVSTQGTDGFEAFTFGNINTVLNPGDYVAFGSASIFFDGLVGLSEWGIVGDEVNDFYPEGSFVFMENGSDFNQLFAQDWGTGNDLFGAPFELATSMALEPSTTPTPVPEPSTFFLLGAGIIGIGLLKKKLGGSQ